METYFSNAWTGFTTYDADEMAEHCREQVSEDVICEVMRDYVNINWLNFLPEDVANEIMDEAGKQFWDDYVEEIEDEDAEEEGDEDDDEWRG